MKDTVAALSASVKTHGLVKTADALGHKNTQSISRWLKAGKIPEKQEKAVKFMLDSELKKRASK